MFIDHIHFYVQDALKTRNWLIEKMGFKHLTQHQNYHTHTEIVTNYCSIFFVISSPINSVSPVYNYLNNHPDGVVDVAFRVEDIDLIMNNKNYEKTTFTKQLKSCLLPEGEIKFTTIKGWKSLNHTLIENKTNTPFVAILPFLEKENKNSLYLPIDQNLVKTNADNNLTSIDHIVLNVNRGELLSAVKFYQRIFNFKILQTFDIKTDNSGLYSQALIAPKNNFYFNINEPTSGNSQIQAFIDINKGSGIQHIALKSNNIIKTVRRMCRQKLPFLEVASNYYQNLKQKLKNELIPIIDIKKIKDIEDLNILIDWQNNNHDSLLMQIFTKPIFNQPTFFFELIERRQKAEGFGAGNFQALFEIVEQELMNYNKN